MITPFSPLEKRGALLFVENARVYARDGAVLVDTPDTEEAARTTAIPALNTPLLLLGEGVELTSDAVAELARANVPVAFVSRGGTSFHAGTPADFFPVLPSSEHCPVAHLQAWARRFANDATRVDAAKELLRARWRLTQRLWSTATYADLNGALPRTKLLKEIESARTLEEVSTAADRHLALIYRTAATSFACPGFVRLRGEHADPLNAQLDQFDQILNALALVVLHGLGLSNALPVMDRRPGCGGLSADLSALFTEGVAIPMAFHLHAQKLPAHVARSRFIAQLREQQVLPLLFTETKRILCGK